MKQPQLDVNALTQYAFMALPLSFVGLPLYIHMPDFYTQEFGLSLAALGTILLAIRSVDALQDPLIGYLSDKFPKRRFSIIFIGLLSILFGMAGLAYGPVASIPVSLWFALFMIVATTGFSVATINLNLLGGFWRNSNALRARISAWRETFSLVGLLLAAVLPTLLAQYFSKQESFILMFWVLAGLTVLAASLFFLFSKKFNKNNVLDSRKKVTRFNFRAILFGYDGKFFLVCFLSYLASSLPAVLVLFYVRDYLGAETWSGLFLVLYFISGAIFMGFWSNMAAKKGLYRAWLMSMLMAVLAFIGATLLQPGDLLAYAIICVVSGMALGGDLSLPPAIIAERIQKQKAQSQSSQYYAVLAFLAKIALALAAAVSFAALDIAGFEAAAENNELALSVLMVCYALAPCLIKLLAALLLWQSINRSGKYHETRQRNLAHGNH